MEEQKVLERLQRQCARMEYCVSDIRRKALKAMEGDPDAADRIVASLVKDRFVDDRRFAAAFAREKSALQGWGTVKIRFQLRASSAGRGFPMKSLPRPCRRSTLRRRPRNWINWPLTGTASSRTTPSAA